LTAHSGQAEVAKLDKQKVLQITPAIANYFSSLLQTFQTLQTPGAYNAYNIRLGMAPVKVSN
jgi:hypothetical protein